MGAYGCLLRYVSNVKTEIILKSLMGLIISATYIVQAIVMARVVDLVWNHAEIPSIIWRIAIVLLMVLIRSLLTREAEAYGKVLAARINSKFRLVILEKVFQLGPGYMNTKRSGKITALILDGIESLEPFFVSYIGSYRVLFLTVEAARPMMDLNRFWHSSFLGLSVAKELFELIETQPDVSELEYPDTHTLDGALPSIALEHMSFSYHDATGWL